jgi:hypothetical protein
VTSAGTNSRRWRSSPTSPSACPVYYFQPFERNVKKQLRQCQCQSGRTFTPDGK